METEPTPPPSAGPYDAPPPPPTQVPISQSDLRMWSMLCHLSSLCGLLLPSFGAVLGPLVVWLIKRNDHPTIDANGRESLNFQLSILIYSWVLGALGVLTLVFLVGFLFLGLAILLGVLSLILAIFASVKVSNGEPYRYPFTIRFF